MVRAVSVLALIFLALAPAESARTLQHTGQQAPLIQGKTLGSGFQGRFSTGGPHSQPGRQAPVSTPPKVSNKAHLVRVGKKEDLTVALERPYEALFGQVGVNKHNYRNGVYTSLKEFHSTVLQD
ncbi:hypothetical protein PENARI_c021G01598 [Penicillium arizonense]|uniref:Secreted protein n=1 Tax=Penicillium arizonense TaxID=1835702 RepID=A0A1F5L8U2_PENAI|nr:hypothetical protein PENARI_c021G01598 [Penicillium arizonense]OGE49487.1 hypothetical protein PENARI_c021G01598 [Penicillium arizonense]